MRAIYLHGFASSPQSTKAQFFRQRLEERGAEVLIPRLDRGDFPALTISGQLEVIAETVADRPAILFGSSLGGYLAALFAARHPALVERLVLLAPAFQFPRRWRQRYTPEELAQWRRQGFVRVFHYGERRELPLGFAFLEDSARYEDEPEFHQPALVFHGVRDEVVPPQVSVDFAAARPNVRLELLDSGHELTDVLEPIWQKTAVFLHLP
jgi:pimeloyl-ACP methyl ester carboxylesterase